MPFRIIDALALKEKAHLICSLRRWGSPEFIGLGFLSFISIVLTEIFGSPFLKNVSIIVGLAVGCIVAGAAGYIDGSSISTAPAITFLWSVPLLFTKDLVR